MLRVAALVVIAALVGGCAASRAEPSGTTGTQTTAMTGASHSARSQTGRDLVDIPAPQLKRQARALLANHIRDLRGSHPSISCGNVYADYVSCSATWTEEGARCQGDFDLVRSAQSLSLPPATTSYCIQISR
jgi:hypothetical protein